jgi:2,3,4,5-tetrahydropyridine-2-carboxylate N-succinyltransferase
LTAGSAAASDLARRIDELHARGGDASARAEALAAFAELRQALNEGRVRAAEPCADHSGWKVNAWVKRGILLGFRWGELSPVAGDGGFLDKHNLPQRQFRLEDRVRIVPGGSSVRDGAYVAPGVVCMPPMFINIGAYVDEGAMIDSRALVGSCAQIGRRVHLSAAAQIGGVLEPVNALPVIIEDEALIGGNSGIYEGTQVGRGAVIAAGTLLTRATALYDLVNGTVHRGSAEQPLRVPDRAVVVSGARAVMRGRGPEWGLSLYTPVIVKYRDEKTDASTALEEWLRA